MDLEWSWNGVILQRKCGCEGVTLAEVGKECVTDKTMHVHC